MKVWVVLECGTGALDTVHSTKESADRACKKANDEEDALFPGEPHERDFYWVVPMEVEE
jgi:hypothetical protein